MLAWDRDRMGLARSDDSQVPLSSSPIVVQRRRCGQAFHCLGILAKLHGCVEKSRYGTWRRSTAASCLRNSLSRMYRAYFEEVQKSGERLTNGSSYPLTRQGP